MTDALRDPCGPHAIAARIRRLIAGQDDATIEAAARRLNVGEAVLRMSADELAPVPALAVIAAIVREYGVDPTWLVTGEYDAQTHRMALEASDAGHSAVVAAALAARKIPPNDSTTGPSDFHLEA